MRGLRFRPARVAAALLLASLAAPVRGAPAQVPARELLEQVGEIVRRNFYDPGGLAGFEAVQQRYLGGAAGRSALSGKNVSRAIDESLQAIGVSHTQRYTPDQLEYYELMDIFAQFGVLDEAKATFPDGRVRYSGIGIARRVVAGRSFVACVYDGSPAQRAGVLVGDEIVAADGKPFAPIGSFAGKAGGEVSLQLRREPGVAPIAVSVPVQQLEPVQGFLAATRASVRVVPRGERRLGYLRIWSYATEDVEALLTELLATEPLKDVDGLVLDLRARWGGAPPDASEMFIGRAADVTLVRSGGAVPLQTRWHKPLVGIVDAGTRSGLEILAHSLQRAGIPLVGSRTAGAVLAGRAYVLRDESLLLLAVADVRVDGERLEGKGVLPDVAVAFELRYAAGRDPQLDRALDELAGRFSN